MSVEQREFIRHPTSIAIRVYELQEHASELHPLANVSIGGLCCSSGQQLPTGRKIRIEFPFLPEHPRLEGHVVWCHECQHGYDIGVQFDDEREAFRARMCEQICHIEQYRQDVFDTEGRQLTSEDAANEWIERHAGDFPNTHV